MQRTGDIFFPKNWISATLRGHNSPEAAQVVRQFLEQHPDYPVLLKNKDFTKCRPFVPIKYSGIYGDFNGVLYYLKGNIKNISISYKIGVSTNNQLAFRYTYRVWHFIGQKFPALRQTVNDFEYHVFIAEERGDKYRRISTGITIHDAFRKQEK